MTQLAWKPNWTDTQRHFVEWWERRGMVLGMWGAPRGRTPHEVVADPGPPPLVEAYTNANLRARLNHFALAGQTFPVDCLPLASADIGPGSLALYLGAEPGFSPQTVWFEPTLRDTAVPELSPPLVFDADNKWWRVTETTLREQAAAGRGKYMASCPDLVENLDIICALRDPQTLMFDMVERPDWVKQKIAEINQVWFAVYQRIYDIIKLEDGSSAFGAFVLWGPGKTAKVQCDAAAMISPAMFREFVVPALTAQCAWLDHSMYHLDGTQCICHLDALLEMEPLDAIEWTPQAGIEGAGHPRWYDLYRRVLAAGKSVQVCGAGPDEIIPLLDAIGGKGVYIMTWFKDEEHACRLAEKVAKYR